MSLPESDFYIVLSLGRDMQGLSSQVRHALHNEAEMNWALGQARGMKYDPVSAVSVNQASYEYSPVEKSLAAFTILYGSYEEYPQAHKMSSALVLVMGPNSLSGSSSVCNPEPDSCGGYYHTRTRTIVIGPVLPPTLWQFQTHNCSSNSVSEFRLYRDMIST